MLKSSHIMFTLVNLNILLPANTSLSADDDGCCLDTCEVKMKKVRWKNLCMLLMFKHE
jgi:hypothetical protein